MRGWTRRWIGRQDGIGRDLRSGTLLERLLAARGLTDEAARSIFERPTLKQLHHPSTLPGATDAAVRLVEAVRSGRSVAIFGDYDVDGIMSSAILLISALLSMPWIIPMVGDKPTGVLGDAIILGVASNGVAEDTGEFSGIGDDVLFGEHGGENIARTP